MQTTGVVFYRRVFWGLLRASICIGILIGLLTLIPGTPVSAQSCSKTVTHTNDSGSGSLRDEVATATAGDVICFDSTFTTPQTITLTSGEIPILTSLTISGTGTDNVIVSGNNASRIFFPQQYRHSCHDSGDDPS